MNNVKQCDGSQELNLTIDDSIIIQQTTNTEPYATCRFINNSNGRVTVTVRYTTGGYSNGTLQYKGDYWDLHVRSGDCYCWSYDGPCNPNCSLTCSPGGVYYVG